MSVLRFAIPKGSLEEKTFALLKQAGYSIRGQKRSYSPILDDTDISLRMLRPQEIPTLIAEGSHDLGISGIDWIKDKFKGKVCIDLDIDRQKITPKGSPADVDEIIRQEVEKLGSKEGGLMMIYGLYPGVPLENIKALMDAMERYAFYYSS